MPWDIRLDTDMQALVDQTLEAERPLVNALKHRIGVLFDRAVRLSPVKTGKFRDSFDFAVTLTPGGEIRALVRNVDPKAWYVHRGKAIRELVFKPANAASEQVMVDTANRWGE